MKESRRDNRRTSRNRNHGKKRATRIVFGIFMVIMTIITLIGGYVAWQVYTDLRSTTDDMYEEVDTDEHESRQTNPVDVNEGSSPFSVLIMGVDTDVDGQIERGRTDTMMVLTVNPNNDQTSIVSIPRDTYTEIVGRDMQDKINHAYAFGGTSMAVNSVQNLFDIPIDYFVSVNMEGMQQVIDAIGGIELTPTLTFSQDNYDFVEGEPVLMNGSKALAYSRMRQTDPDGDYGRQFRQRQVIEGTMQQIASFDSVRNYSDILGAMSENMRTNMQFDDMRHMFNNYRQSADNVEQLQLSGSGQMMDGVYYEIIPDEELARVREHLAAELELN